MPRIQRWGEAKRWSDVVVHAGVARWVEVAEDPTLDASGQTRQTLAQVDATLAMIGSDRQSLLEILVYLADLADAADFNREWDAWVPSGHAPVRACVQAGLSPGYRVEIVVSAAVD